MSGFENLTSTYTSRLHPAVDPHDSYDPTFMCVKRKRRIPEPKATETIITAGGKHIDKSKMRHDPTAFAQLEHTHVPESFRGSTQSTRFGTGFARRSAATIGIDALREAENDRLQRRHETLLEHRRRENTLRGQSGVAHVFGSSATQVSQPANRSVARTAALRNSQSTVFAPPDPNQSTRAAARLDRLQREGLTVTRKDWSVKQQLTALDGYSLPQI